MKQKKKCQDLLTYSLTLLSSREYSEQELINKLCAKTKDLDLINETLIVLHKNNFQSDKRYCDSYLNSAYNKGYGPYKLKSKLKLKGIDDNLIQETLSSDNIDWQKLLRKTHIKKFKKLPTNNKVFYRQARFLQQRGFDIDSINKYLNYCYE